LIHVGAFNLSLILRKLLGAGTPRELRNRFGSLVLRLFQWLVCRNQPNHILQAAASAVPAVRDPSHSRAAMVSAHAEI